MTAQTLGSAAALYEHQHELFRESARAFLQQEVVPHHDAGERAGIVPRELFTKAGAAGFIGIAVPEAFGGAGVDDPRFWAIFVEEAGRESYEKSVFEIVEKLEQAVAETKLEGSRSSSPRR